MVRGLARAKAHQPSNILGFVNTCTHLGNRYDSTAKKEGNKNKITKKDIINGLSLTGYFLEKRIYSDINKNLPQTRKKLIDFLNK